MEPRSSRNNNPGNIRVGMPWVGLMPSDQKSPEQSAETAFCVFKNPAYGFRALAMTLLTYSRKYKLQTVNAIISRFAPANENDTRAYVVAVSSALGVLPLNLIPVTDPTTLAALCKAIAMHEAGGWLFDTTDLETGVSWALGITPTPPDDDNGPIAA